MFNLFKKLKAKKALLITIEKVGFSARTYNCLRRVGITMLGELAGMRKCDLYKIRNLGKRNIEEIDNKLQENGLKLIEENN